MNLPVLIGLHLDLLIQFQKVLDTAPETKAWGNVRRQFHDHLFNIREAMPSLMNNNKNILERLDDFAITLTYNQ